MDSLIDGRYALLPRSQTQQENVLALVFKFFALFIWLHWVLVASYELLAVACGIQRPEQGGIADILHWERGVPVTEPPGKSSHPGLLKRLH